MQTVRDGSVCNDFKDSSKPIKTPSAFYWGFSGKESSCQCRRCKRRRFDPWFGKIPGRRKWQPTPVFLPGKSHGQRSLAGTSPRGCKESDMTDQPNSNKNCFLFLHVLAILNNVNNKILSVLCPPRKPVFSCFCLCYHK